MEADANGTLAIITRMASCVRVRDLLAGTSYLRVPAAGKDELIHGYPLSVAVE